MTSIKKALALSPPGILLVAESDQISNLELIRDLIAVVDYLEDWESTRQCT